MLRRPLPYVLACVLALGLSSVQSAVAIEWLHARKGYRHRSAPTAPAYLGNPKGLSAGPPAPHRYPEYNAYYPWYGYGLGVPTYNWGYFGVRYRPACLSHKGYYGDFSQWTYRRGY